MPSRRSIFALFTLPLLSLFNKDKERCHIKGCVGTHGILKYNDQVFHTCRQLYPYHPLSPNQGGSFDVINITTRKHA